MNEELAYGGSGSAMKQSVPVAVAVGRSALTVYRLTALKLLDVVLYMRMQFYAHR